MPEIKRGYKEGDYEAGQEAKMLEGITWASWRQILANQLANKGLAMPENNNEDMLHGWFVLRHLRKLRKISPAEYNDRKEKIFEGKNEIFGDPSMTFAITFINTKTEQVKS